MSDPPARYAPLRWIAGCLLLALAPQVPELPWWITLTVAAGIAIRLALARRDRGPPPAWLRAAIAMLSIVLLFFKFHTFNGIDAGSALLALMAGLKFLEARSLRDIYILALLAYFISLAALLTSTSLALLLYLLGVFWLTTAALARLTRAEPGPDWRRALFFAARLMAMSAPLAIALWLFFPRFASPLWNLPRAESAALSGLGDSMDPADLSELALSGEVAFRARFDAAAPPPDQRYWRGPVLHAFDGRIWRRGDLDAAGAAAPQPQGNGYRYTSSIEPHGFNWLFALDRPVRWDAAGAFLNRDLMLVQAGPVSRPIVLEATSYPRAQTEAALSEAQRRRDTQLPARRNPKSLLFAQQLRARNADDRAFAGAVLDHFRHESFYYTLAPPRLGVEAVDEFLFDTKRGFCGHYASAFALLMRAAGIPARVVTGYQGGTYNRYAGYWIVSQSDAHAWDEIWLPGQGWVRFDPTAAIAPERIERGSGDAPFAHEGSAAGWLRRSAWIADWRLRLDALREFWVGSALSFDQRAQMSLLERLGVPQPDPAKLAIAVAAALIAATLWLTWVVGRELGRGREDALRGAFDALSRKLARIGLPRAASESASHYAERVGRRRPDLAEDLRALCLRYNELRYGGAASREDIRDFRAAVRGFRARRG